VNIQSGTYEEGKGGALSQAVISMRTMPNLKLSSARRRLGFHNSLVQHTSGQIGPLLIMRSPAIGLATGHLAEKPV